MCKFLWLNVLILVVIVLSMTLGTGIVHYYAQVENTVLLQQHKFEIIGCVLALVFAIADINIICKKSR